MAPVLPAVAEQRRRLVAARRIHWRRTRRVTAMLLLVWLATGFCTVFFARELAAWSLFGWPLPFYLAAQGASLMYLAILGAYVLAMRRADRRFLALLKAAPGVTS
ncbi:MAG TPA: sodium/substrate symporter small subunit [Telluria sp.]|jgi:putative solute:sodium symporter small subunit